MSDADGGDLRMDGMEDAVERMQKYIRVLRRVSRVYLGECKRPGKNKRLADKLGLKLANAFTRTHPMP